jgi:predicted phosphodiesterase
MGIDGRIPRKRTDNGAPPYLYLIDGDGERAAAVTEIAYSSVSEWLGRCRDSIDAMLARPPKPPPDTSSPAKPGHVHRIVGLFDVHVPQHDVQAWRAALAWIADHRPDEIIIGGDFLELESCSQHGGVARPAMLLEEAEAGKRALRELREAAGHSASILYIEGNHETRLARTVVANLPTIEGVVSIPSLLGLDELGITWAPGGVPVRRGKLSFIHGSFANEYHAAKHLRVYGTSVTYGHTHRPQVSTRATATSSLQGSFAMGCLRTLEPGWLNGVPAGWAHGFGIYEIHPDGDFTVYPVIMGDRKFSWGGKIYGVHR